MLGRGGVIAVIPGVRAEIVFLSENMVYACVMWRGACPRLSRKGALVRLLTCERGLRQLRLITAHYGGFWAT